jgi:hypothetical protein
MMKKDLLSNIAPTITWNASKQTYYTIRFLVDRDRVLDAYRAYAYFRWVDDTLDGESLSIQERREFLARQKSILEGSYKDKATRDLHPEEHMLVDLIRNDTEKDSDLQSYLRNMMIVMDFDIERRGRSISKSELDNYTYWLAVAVTDAMHYFIGHSRQSTGNEYRYLAVTAAHIAHMLRDTFDDIEAGYYNVPREVLEENQIGLRDVQSEAYRDWVKSRVDLAHEYFRAGRVDLVQVHNIRYRIACLAYVARFEWLLDTIEREGYCLRPQYNERKSVWIGLRMGWHTFSSLLGLRRMDAQPRPVLLRPPEEL